MYSKNRAKFCLRSVRINVSNLQKEPGRKFSSPPSQTPVVRPAGEWLEIRASSRAGILSAFIQKQRQEALFPKYRTAVETALLENGVEGKRGGAHKRGNNAREGGSLVPLGTC